MGKGSKRRQEDTRKVRAHWDSIQWKKRELAPHRVIKPSVRPESSNQIDKPREQE